MKIHRGIIKKFKLNPKYLHTRSEGLTHRTNSGSFLQKRIKRK